MTLCSSHHFSFPLLFFRKKGGNYSESKMIGKLRSFFRFTYFWRGFYSKVSVSFGGVVGSWLDSRETRISSPPFGSRFGLIDTTRLGRTVELSAKSTKSGHFCPFSRPILAKYAFSTLQIAEKKIIWPHALSQGRFWKFRNFNFQEMTCKKEFPLILQLFLKIVKLRFPWIPCIAAELRNREKPCHISDWSKFRTKENYHSFHQIGCVVCSILPHLMKTAFC